MKSRQRVTAQELPSSCHSIMADIVAKFATTHDLREPR